MLRRAMRNRGDAWNGAAAVFPSEPAFIGSPADAVQKPLTRRLTELGLALGAAWLARAVFIVVMPARAHSADVDSWITVAQQLRAGANPYATTHFLNWPPMWMMLVWVIDHAARGLGLSFFLTLRLFLIAVESVLIATLYWFLARVEPGQALRISGARIFARGRTHAREALLAGDVLVGDDLGRVGAPALCRFASGCRALRLGHGDRVSVL